MDELERVGRFYGEARETDAGAKARARRVLTRRFATRRRRLPLVAAVAAAIGVAAAMSIVWMPGGTRPAAATALHQVAVIATDLDLAAGSKPVVYETSTRREIEVGTSFASDDIFRLAVRSEIEVWRGADGAVDVRQRATEAEFVSPSDQRTWERFGEPDVTEPGDVTLSQSPDADVPLVRLEGLPSEPGALLEAIRNRWTAEQIDTDAELLRAIGELLARGDATPALRADLFRAAAQIPGIELLGTIRDPLDREGMGIALGPPERRVTLIVDPNTSVLLSVEERFPLMGEIMSEWIAYSEWATVPEIGDRPDGSDVV